MHQHHDRDHHGHAGGSVAEDDKATCPVMHIPVSKREAEENGLVRTYEGKTFYLCCRACGQQFDAEPDKYSSTELGSL